MLTDREIRTVKTALHEQRVNLNTLFEDQAALNEGLNPDGVLTLDQAKKIVALEIDGKVHALDVARSNLKLTRLLRNLIDDQDVEAEEIATACQAPEFFVRMYAQHDLDFLRQQVERLEDQLTATQAEYHAFVVDGLPKRDVEDAKYALNFGGEDESDLRALMEALQRDQERHGVDARVLKNGQLSSIDEFLGDVFGKEQEEGDDASE